MHTALIGSTGFVGSNLARQHTFTHLYNSATIKESHDQEFDLVVSAAPSAVKWKANKFPEEDKHMMDAFLADLAPIRTKTCICISTCDVYHVPREVDEMTDPHDALPDLHPYGTHRLELEDFVRAHFADHLIVRLPALFGDGLKKNIVYDFMHDNQLEAIDSRGSFQFYNLAHLWADIEKARVNGLQLLNITTAPVSVAEIAKECFDRAFVNEVLPTPARYDIRSAHAALWGSVDGYLYDKATELAELKAFVQANT